MKIPYSILKKLVPQLSLSPVEVANLLTLNSYEVDSVLDISSAYVGVVVGQIKSIQPHPNADKLKVTEVSIDDNQTPLVIVCGASNIQIGNKVPVATIGTQLPNGMNIQQASLRGVDSFGMLCSAKELNLSQESEGVMILSDSFAVGAALSQVLNLNEVVIDIDNKGLGTRAADSSSFYGVAREVSILTNYHLNDIALAHLPRQKPGYSVKIQTRLCQYYSLLEVKDLSQYAFDSNVLSKGNYRVDLYVQTEKYQLDPVIVNTLKTLHIPQYHPAIDLGNYITHEIGQPMHVFDIEKVAGKTLIVREAQDGETMISLDGTELILQKGDIVITDAEKIIALAGIIGSNQAAVSDGTTGVLVESAHFDAQQIRATARRLKLLTDAAKRFERGIPSYIADQALARYAYFLEQAQVTVAGYQSWGRKNNEKKSEIRLDYRYVNSYLGVELDSNIITKLLERVGCEVVHSRSEEHTILPPIWRLDLTTPEELIEEIARLYGYDKIPIRLDISLLPIKNNPLFEIQRSISRSLVAQGYTEIMTYPYSTQGIFRMKNPVNQEAPYLRTTLVPHMEESLKKNLLAREELSLFEISHVFGEKEEVFLVLGYISRTVKTSSEVAHQLYQTLFRSFLQMGVKYTNITRIVEDNIILVLYQEQEIGKIFATKGVLEINLSTLVAISGHQQEIFSPLAKYPAVKRDITVQVDSVITAQQVYDTIVSLATSLCELVYYKSIYQEGIYNKYTFGLQFRANDRSLSDEEVNTIMDSIEKGF